MAQSKPNVTVFGVNLAQQIGNAFRGQLSQGVLTRRLDDAETDTTDVSQTIVETYHIEGSVSTKQVKNEDGKYQDMLVVKIFGDLMEGLTKTGDKVRTFVSQGWDAMQFDSMQFGPDIVTEGGLSIPVNAVPQVGDEVRFTSNAGDLDKTYKLKNLINVGGSRASYEFEAV